ncbi:uncharacterized protein LOC133841776 [Drosophila sulfurigaster albostrigata]|uniref:uncharacterized protein LOC133841776 n=1 Tax=Drosophila sulfurigaster albostrigata TaxID=89887 RepID=UPI002D21AF2D|nr:uncharacterized protein LOC133841776 [Drosophila sulfurigaster albostrigata]
MSKFVLLLVFCSLCLLQVQADRRICEQLTRVCERNEPRIGIEDDVTKYLNAECRRRDVRWKNITRCQLERAACELSLVECGELSCANIVKVLRR